MIDKHSYEQIPIPENLSDVLPRARHRWEAQKRRRIRQLALTAACAAFIFGASIPIVMQMRSGSIADPNATGSSGTASSSERIDTEPASGQEDTYSFLPTYQGDIDTKPSETVRNPALEALIISYYEIPQDCLQSTRYYYNYIDLNNDGTDEIFVDVMGMYTSGSGGDSALIVSQKDEDLTVLQSFTLVNMPVIVSDHTTNGWNDLIFSYTGGGAESSYMISSYSQNGYPNIADGTLSLSLDGITGTSILYTDLTAADSPQLTLGN